MKVTEEMLVAALMSNGTVKQAAKSLNISESNMRKRMQGEEFTELYNEAQERVLDEVITSLQSKITSALDVLVDVMEDKKNNAAVRSQCAMFLIKSTVIVYEKAELLKLKEQAAEW